MSRRLLFALLAVFVALVVVTVLQQQRGAPENNLPEGSLTFMGRELQMTVLDIQAIRLRDPNSGASFVISRGTNGNWIAPGSEGRLDPEAASNIAKTLVLMPFQRTAALDNSANLSQYGFNPNGTLLIDVVLNNQGGHAIAIGGLSPTEVTYYALVDDLPQVYFIERGAVDYLLTQLSQPPLT